MFFVGDVLPGTLATCSGMSTVFENHFVTSLPKPTYRKRSFCCVSELVLLIQLGQWVPVGGSSNLVFCAVYSCALFTYRLLHASLSLLRCVPIADVGIAVPGTGTQREYSCSNMPPSTCELRNSVRSWSAPSLVMVPSPLTNSLWRAACSQRRFMLSPIRPLSRVSASFDIQTGSSKKQSPGLRCSIEAKSSLQCSFETMVESQSG